MSSYNQPNAKPAAFTAQATGSAVKVFSTNLSTRVGYWIFNASALPVSVMECPSGDVAPTSAEVVATPTWVIEAGKGWNAGARGLTDIYVATSGGTATVYAQELK